MNDEINPINQSMNEKAEALTKKYDLPSKPFVVDGEGGGFSEFKKWLGEKGYAEFEKNLCKSITQQIAKDKARAHKASEELKKSETGEN